MIMTLYEAALKYADKGWFVLPLHTPDTNGVCSCTTGADCPDIGKHPRYDPDLLPHGLNSATTDPDLIKKMWEKWPDANIGIVTGPGSGIVALDVDPRSTGDETLFSLTSQNGHLPDTPHSHTGGGGDHYLFKHPGHYVKGKAGALGPGLDIKGDGGYIIVEPSIHVEGVYLWDDELHPENIELAEIPAWIVENLQAPEPEPEGPAVEFQDLIPEGKRNEGLTSLGGNARRQGSEYTSILAYLLAENQSRCVPPLDEKEVQRIAQSVARYKPGAPLRLMIDDPAFQDPWQVYTMEDVFKPRPPREHLVDGILELPSLVMFFGKPGEFKSMLAGDLGVSVAGGAALAAALT